MPTLGAPLDFAKLEGRNLRAHQLGAAPSSPVTGQLYYNTGDNTLYWYDGTQWISTRASVPPDATPSVKGIVQLAGDLAGTAASPQIAPGVITDSEVAAANKDGGAAVPSLRTLGAGASQAAAGNDARLTDARVPTAHKTTHEPGGSDPMTVDAVVATGSLRTLGAGAQQAMPGNRTLDAITAPAASVNMNGQRIINMLDPIGSNEAATKNYVDNLSMGLDTKASVKAASTVNLTLSGAQTVDGVALIAGDRCLVKDQSSPATNGIYIVASGAWTRAPDMDVWGEIPSAFTWVEQGTTQADTGWVSTADQGGTLNTTAITWTQFSGSASLIAGAGLTKSGNTVDVGAGAGITVNADSVQVANNGIVNAMLADGAVDLAAADVTGALPLTKGGSGQITAKAAREIGFAAAGYYSNGATHGAGAVITITQATHGLRATRALMVQVQDNATGNVELPDISVSAAGDVTITYAASVSANSKLVTVIG
jgi:Repeat of unknown function (DUF5907)